MHLLLVLMSYFLSVQYLYHSQRDDWADLNSILVHDLTLTNLPVWLDPIQAQVEHATSIQVVSLMNFGLGPQSYKNDELTTYLPCLWSLLWPHLLLLHIQNQSPISPGLGFFLFVTSQKMESRVHRGLSIIKVFWQRAKPATNTLA